MKPLLKFTTYYFILLYLCSCNDNIANRFVLHQNKINIEINQNIETVGIILSLSDYAEKMLISDSSTNNYCIKSYRSYFQKYRKHPTITLTNDLTKEGLFHIYRPYYALYYTALPEFKKETPLEMLFYKSNKYSKHELDSIYDNLSIAIRQFYIDADLESFFNKHQSLYKKIKNEVQSTMLFPNLLDTLNQFYGTDDKVKKFIIIPSPTLFETSGFGDELVRNDTSFFYQLLSSFGGNKSNLFKKIEYNDTLGFEKKKANFEYSIHEFGHSFVRFLDKPENKKMIAKTEKLNFNSMKRLMSKFGQSNDWNNIFEEHLVRASEIIVLGKLNKKEFIKEKTENEIKIYGFVYLPVFIEELKKYDMNKDKYSSLEKYLPILIERLNKLDKKQYILSDI